MEYGKEDLDKLKNIGYKIIKEEYLPMPKEIKFKNSLSGGFRQNGCLIKYGRTNTYKILVNLRKAKFFEDTNGKYKDKKGIKWRRAIIGNIISFDEIKDTLAHEIAHLKIWNHPPEHKEYTNYILEKINKEYENGNC